MRRRSFISLLGGAAAWPLAVRAQQAALPVIGLLFIGPPDQRRERQRSAFRQGLAEIGYVEDRNVTFEYLWGPLDQFDALPALAGELVRRRVAVIIASGEAPAKAAKVATTTIPIVFATGGDPVKASLVASLNRPGGNVTGVSYFSGALGAKKLSLMRELVPKPGPLALLMNPNNPTDQSERSDIQAAAGAIGQQIEVLNASSQADFETAFAALVQRGASGLLVAIDPNFLSGRDRLIALAARYAVPTIYFDRDFADAGGLMSYSSSSVEAYRQAGHYSGRILKGEKPGDLPIMLPTKFEFVINLQTARALGIDVPPTLVAQADEVIE
jgi:putative ABC transport system substrate-binding protein